MNLKICGSCSFELQEDWSLCPKCGLKIEKSESIVAISDSVIMGDVRISGAALHPGEPVHQYKCTSCNSHGGVLHSCRGCSKLIYCEVCEDDYFQDLTEMIWKSQEYSDDFRALDMWKGHVGTINSRYISQFNANRFHQTNRACFECLTGDILPGLDRLCWSCNRHSRGRLEITIMHNDIQTDYVYSTCQTCIELHDSELEESEKAGSTRFFIVRKESWRSFVIKNKLPYRWYRTAIKYARESFDPEELSLFEQAWNEWDSDAIVKAKKLPVSENFMTKIEQKYPIDENTRWKWQPHGSDFSELTGWMVSNNPDDPVGLKIRGVDWFRRNNYWKLFN
jgi:hypothetical protein